MKISEQISRILDAAPHLAYQSWTAVLLIGGLILMVYQASGKLLANWQEGTANLVEHRDVQERTRDDEPEYFYQVIFKYQVGDEGFRVTRERGFRTVETALQTLEEELKIDTTPVWYSSWNPSNSTLDEGETTWSTYLWGIIPILLVLTFFRWYFLKYYELELEE